MISTPEQENLELLLKHVHIQKVSESEEIEHIDCYFLNDEYKVEVWSSDGTMPASSCMKYHCKYFEFVRSMTEEEFENEKYN